MAPIDIESVRFTPVRVKRGYEMGPVDVFLDRVQETLGWLDVSAAELRRHNDTLASSQDTSGGAGDMVSRAVMGPDPDPLSERALTTVRLREAYDIAEVDALLSEVDAEEARLRDALAAERLRNTALVDALPADARPIYTAPTPASVRARRSWWRAARRARGA